MVTVFVFVCMFCKVLVSYPSRNQEDIRAVSDLSVVHDNEPKHSLKKKTSSGISGRRSPGADSITTKDP